MTIIFNLFINTVYCGNECSTPEMAIKLKKNECDQSISSIDFGPEKAASYLSKLPRINDAIDLSQFTELQGGGTHNIYRLNENPQFLLKVMKKSIGNDLEKLGKDLAELTAKYELLYQVFGTTRCLVERRFIEQVYVSEQEGTKNAIVSVVQFDSCFDSAEKFGFNISSVESNEIDIKKNLSKYHSMNLGSLGPKSFYDKFDLEDFLVFESSFRPIFKMLDEDESLREAMKDFLIRFKIYYKKTDQLMDITGRDNVLFYKSVSGWKYKVGSVIKHETGKETRKMLREISTNPSAVDDSFENWTLIFYVPSWVRALNATSKKLEMDKIVENISLSMEDSQNLAKIHEVLPLGHRLRHRAIYYATNGSFEEALQLFDESEKISSSHNSKIRDFLGTEYWCWIKKEEIDQINQTEKKRIAIFLGLLVDPKNEFSLDRWATVRPAIQGLLFLLQNFGSIDPNIKKASELMLQRLDVTDVTDSTDATVLKS